MGIIVGNWKMNGNKNFASEMIRRLNGIDSENTIVICPPSPLLYMFNEFKYSVGAQDCFYQASGAFTGENSPILLKEMGCEYVIIGHSERRSLFLESDDLIYKKWEAAVSCGLIPIVCIGECASERKIWKDVLCTQLERYIGKNFCKTIFAYEPVWSIGTGIIPTVKDIEEVSAFIKYVLGSSSEYSILYGGSVNARNVSQILACNNIDGVLVGGASLKAEEFVNIIKNCR